MGEENEETIQKINQEFSLLVDAMDKIHSYLYEALEGDNDDILNDKIGGESDVYGRKIFISNEISSFRRICKMEWYKIDGNLPSVIEMGDGDKENVRRELENFKKSDVKDEINIGTYCTV